MSARKRLQITVVTEQAMIIRQRDSARAWCPNCACEVDMVGIEAAGVLAGLTQSQLRERVASGEWHVSEAKDGSSLICLDSLLKFT